MKMKDIFNFLMSLDTQIIREELINKLKEIMDFCYEKSVNPGINPKRREKWARLAAYIAQTINSILSAYDEQDIKKQIQLLKEKLKLLEEMAE